MILAGMKTVKNHVKVCNSAACLTNVKPTPSSP